MEIEHPTAQDLENAIKLILSNYDDINREGLTDTPKRILNALNELLTAKEPNLTTFSSNGYNQMISDKNISYYTFCEHHFLPFFGTVKIAYIPKDKIVGLSKLSRVVEYFSKRLNTQEYFTDNIANYLQEKLQPLGLGVMVTGRHLCKEMRGVRKDSIMTTCSLKGVFLEQATKMEFLNL